MVFERIRALLASQLDVDEDKISMDTDIIEEFGADSLDLVEIMSTVESEFNVIVTDEAAHGIKTVGDIVEIIERYVH